MIVVMQPGAGDAAIAAVEQRIRAEGIAVHVSRGIRAFETAYRNVLDVTAIAVLKRETHLPVIVDPSHAGGKAWMVPALACVAVAAGADGLLVETHPNPPAAWCDADQALTPAEFSALMRKLGAVAAAVGRTLPVPRAAPDPRMAREFAVA
jgi:3-deoxy-7-phosphoheptulonate synthase